MRALRRFLGVILLSGMLLGGGVALSPPASACMGEICDGICDTWAALGSAPVGNKYFSGRCPLG